MNQKKKYLHSTVICETLNPYLLQRAKSVVRQNFSHWHSLAHSFSYCLFTYIGNEKLNSYVLFLLNFKAGKKNKGSEKNL